MESEPLFGYFLWMGMKICEGESCPSQARAGRLVDGVGLTACLAVSEGQEQEQTIV